jgi:hypothetical protein
MPNDTTLDPKEIIRKIEEQRLKSKSDKKTDTNKTAQVQPSEQKLPEKKLSEQKLPEKRLFDVKVETMLPATLIYRVLAENEVKAAEMIKRVAPNSIHHRLPGKRDIKLMVYDAGTTLLRWTKNLLR